MYSSDKELPESSKSFPFALSSFPELLNAVYCLLQSRAEKSLFAQKNNCYFKNTDKKY